MTPSARCALEQPVTNVDDNPGDACLCGTCHRRVAGSDGDIKVCVVQRGENLVLCDGCFRRDERRDRWLEWRSVAPPEPSDPWLAACGWPAEVG